jgi:hypothetical protein
MSSCQVTQMWLRLTSGCRGHMLRHFMGGPPLVSRRLNHAHNGAAVHKPNLDQIFSHGPHAPFSLLASMMIKL